MSLTDPHDPSPTDSTPSSNPSADPTVGPNARGQEQEQAPDPTEATAAGTTSGPAWWLSVHRERLRQWRRRALPRLARWTTDSARNAPGMARAVLLVGAVTMAPWLRWFAVSPRWARIGTAISNGVLSRAGWSVAALALVAAVLLRPGVAAGLLLAAAPVGALALLWARTKFRHSTFARIRARFGADGWADFWELHRGVSAHAARGVAVTHRPSLAAMLPVVPARCEAGSVAVVQQRARRAALIERLPVTECGTWLGRSTVGPWWGVQCYAAFRDTVGLIAPPQTGKTALMTHHVVDHPGAVISTSTKPEVYLMTATLRELRSASGRVELFNPDDLGGLGSTLRWDPVRGCGDFRTAMTRAGLLVGGRADSGGSEARWNEWATEVLAGLLMVADLELRTMHDIARWCHAPTDKEHGAGQALTLMGRHREAIPDGVYDSLAQVLTTRADKTRDSVFFALRGAVGFMSDPTVAALCTPRRDEPAFDVERFLADRGTLYLLGAEEQNTATAPLLAALTGHIFATAKHLATHRPGAARLDPPLLISLDEAALITPVPLPQWVSDAGGRGIHIVWSVQTPSQLRDRWGDEGAQTILNATNSLLIFGGLKNRDDLAEASDLCGYRHELVPDPDGDGPGHAKFERVPVCPPDRVRLLDTWHALLIHRTTPATVVRIRPAWQRPDIAAAPRPHPARPAVPAPRPGIDSEPEIHLEAA